jgi:hypothetical protein
VRGLLYDLRHFDDIKDEHLRRYGSGNRWTYCFLRDDRGAALGTLLLLLVVAVLLAMLCGGAGRRYYV